MSFLLLETMVQCLQVAILETFRTPSSKEAIFQWSMVVRRRRAYTGIAYFYTDSYYKNLPQKIPILHVDPRFVREFHLDVIHNLPFQLSSEAVCHSKVHHCFKKHSAERKGSVARSHKLFSSLHHCSFWTSVATCEPCAEKHSLHLHNFITLHRWWTQFSYALLLLPQKDPQRKDVWHVKLTFDAKTQRQKRGLYLDILKYPHVTTWFQKCC